MNVLTIAFSVFVIFFFSFIVPISNGTETESPVISPLFDHRQLSSSHRPQSPVKHSLTPISEPVECKKIIEKEILGVEKFLQSVKGDDDFSKIERVPYENQLKDLRELLSSITAASTKKDTEGKIRQIIRQHFPQDDY